MRRSTPIVLAFALFFLFFIQMAGTLIQSIYVLDLMNTSLDAKVLGVLFFFTPAVLFFFRRRLPDWVLWTLVGLLFLARGLTPSLPTQGRLVTSGIAAGAALILLPFLFTAKPRNGSSIHMGSLAAAGLALAVGLSVFLRTLDFSIDYSLTPRGAWAGWLLGVGLVTGLTRLEWAPVDANPPKARGITPALMGVFLVLTLVYFAFSAPAVIARWTEGIYPVIVALVSLLSLASVYFFVEAPETLDRLSHRVIVLWNVLFTLALTGTLLAGRVSFPTSPDSAPVVIGSPAEWQQVPLYLMLLLFPVVFIDLRLLFGQIREIKPSPREMVPGLLLGGLALVLLVFMNIFTNVWGYVEPVSTPFRNQFWLPFFLITGGLTLIAWRLRPGQTGAAVEGSKINWEWLSELGVIFAITVFSVLAGSAIHPGDPARTSLVVMTYNIQAGNDASAQSSYDRQLELIRKIDPDILAMQETDTARISMNNNDYVRYFAGKLGYYSYFGPTPLTGTFGTAILSKYPLENRRVVFTYSDSDEVGTTEAVIQVGGRTFHIHDVHPDGSAAAKLAFAQALVERASGEENVIALGDYNLREDASAYQVVAAELTDAWKSLHPDEKGEGKGWIDHIFISPDLKVKDPTYILPPESATDHPAHWAVIYWE
jgi:endonuclease/exonuclease/phosphatase family metal-dependent hydrolase